MVHSFVKHPLLPSLLLLLCFVFSLCSARIVEIGNICSKHNNPNSCDNILRSVPGATSGVDLGSISLYLINMAHVNAFETIGQISYNIRKATNTQTKQRYNSCIMDYDDVLLSLTQAKQSYNSGNYAALKSNGITVIEDVKDCDTKAYDLPQLRMNNQYLVDVSMIIMILADFLAGKF
ncbi:hypothetical protein AAZX31_16G051900 [Glycine max]|nr:hypothetical protein JHK86_044487 [Glycine max]